MSWLRKAKSRRRVDLEQEFDEVAGRVSEFGQEVGRTARKKSLGLWGEFKKFVKRGNVIDMAVGIAVGTAFTNMVKSLVNDLIMPPVGMLIGYVDFANLFVVLKPGDPAPPYSTLADATTAGAVTLSYGQFVNTVLSFFIVALAVFFLVKTVNRVLPEPEKPAPATKTCPYCSSTIPASAQRCPNCTSILVEPTGPAAYGPSDMSAQRRWIVGPGR